MIELDVPEVTGISKITPTFIQVRQANTLIYNNKAKITDDKFVIDVKKSTPLKREPFIIEFFQRQGQFSIESGKFR